MKILYPFIFALLISCTPKVTTKQIDLLNGYWTISEAKAPNGEIRPYTGTVEVDFFELNDAQGFRKKLKPLFDSKFNSTNDKVSFTVSFDNKGCIITYSRQQHNWQEEVITLNEDELQLKDARGVVFHYKRFQP